MKTPKHAPGPWHARQDTSPHAANHWEVVCASPFQPGLTHTVCDINGPYKAENYAANARLIAAAPELLAALQQAEKAMAQLLSAAVMAPIAVRNFPPFKLGENMTDQALFDARATIAKATGQSV